MSAELKLIAFPSPPPKTMADVLREVARQIDVGTLPNPSGAVLVIEHGGGKIDAYGLGDMADVVRGIGLLNIASWTLVRGYDVELREREAKA